MDHINLQDAKNRGKCARWEGWCGGREDGKMGYLGMLQFLLNLSTNLKLL